MWYLTVVVICISLIICAPKNWCFWSVVLEKTLESPLDCKEIQPVHPKRDQSWVFIERTDAEAEAPVLWPPHTKSWLIGKDADAGRDWGQEEKGTTEDDGWMASPTRWAWVSVNSGSWWWIGKPGVLRLWGRKESDTTEWLNWIELNYLWCGSSSICLLTLWISYLQKCLFIPFVHVLIKLSFLLFLLSCVNSFKRR